MIRELLDAGLLHADTKTVGGDGLALYTQEPKLVDGDVVWPRRRQILNEKILRPASDPFQPKAVLTQLSGNLGRGVIKTSAVRPSATSSRRPPACSTPKTPSKTPSKRANSQDTVIVVRFQGPKSNGMPELHGLTPILAVLQDRGLKVALVTDGRMSGASGKVPSAIHVCPEAADAARSPMCKTAI